jgi:AcrR family transcriptional regulator
MGNDTAPRSTPRKGDGRRARRERNRIAVIDAMVELLVEDRKPSVESVAERSGVSVSSVFRYFDNLDDLHRQTVERYFERFDPLFTVPELGDGPLDLRIRHLVGARVELYETIAPIAREARRRAAEHPLLAERLRATRTRLLDQLREHFAPELAALPRSAAEDRLALIDTMTSFESWDLLRTGHGRSPRRIARAWSLGLDAVLQP